MGIGLEVPEQLWSKGSSRLSVLHEQQEDARDGERVVEISQGLDVLRSVVVRCESSKRACGKHDRREYQANDLALLLGHHISAHVHNDQGKGEDGSDPQAHERDPPEDLMSRPCVVDGLRRRRALVIAVVLAHGEGSRQGRWESCPWS